MEHRLRKDCKLGTRQPAPEHSHQPGRCLIIRNLVTRNAIDKEFNFVPRQFSAIPFFADQIDDSHPRIVAMNSPEFIRGNDDFSQIRTERTTFLSNKRVFETLQTRDAGQSSIGRWLPQPYITSIRCF